MADIYRSVIPYTLVMMLGLILIMLFPKIATWLPSLVL
jgi:TRAP-type mannitol/chloroaromatic compound transport system permease large subunit